MSCVFCKGERDADEHFQENGVTDRMVAVGALHLARYLDGVLSPDGLIDVARRVFCAMRAEEAQQRAPSSMLGR